MRRPSLLPLALALALAPAAGAQPVEADVRFMREMIPHHAQALEMTDLVEQRTENPRIRMLAERIAVSQADEIGWMEAWLDAHGRAVPPEGDHAHHAGHGELMPGMLTPEEMAALAGSSGPTFDRLFLEGMIRHHEGALVMVDTLLATPGAAQATEVYQIATDIGADQRADIDRMRAMLDALPPSAER